MAKDHYIANHGTVGDYCNASGNLGGDIVGGVTSIATAGLGLSQAKKNLEAAKLAAKAAGKQLDADYQRSVQELKLAEQAYRIQQLQANKELALQAQSHKVWVPIAVIGGLVLLAGVAGFVIYRKRTAANNISAQ